MAAPEPRIGPAPALREIATRALWPPLIVFAVHAFLSLALHAYDAVAWLDVVMHLAGGGAIACFFARSLDSLERYHVVTPIDPKLRVVLVLALTSTAAVLWEFGEFTFDSVTGMQSQAGLADTLGDLALGMLGGAAYLVAARRTPD